MQRRTLMTGALALGMAPRAMAQDLPAVPPGAADISEFEIQRTESEWRAMLSDIEYAVMRREATEEPFSSPLNDIKADGVFNCKGCENPLYDSATKFMSGTGWPSFTEALPNAIRTKKDRAYLFLVRTECHCARCGSHLGHIFEDGPAPTGLRHCINGVSLVFEAA